MLPSLYITESQKPSNIKTDFDKIAQEKEFWEKIPKFNFEELSKSVANDFGKFHKTTSISTVIDFDKLRSV